MAALGFVDIGGKGNLGRGKQWRSGRSTLCLALGCLLIERPHAEAQNQRQSALCTCKARITSSRHAAA